MKSPAYIPEALSRQPKGLTILSHAQAKPMIRMVSKMLKPKFRGLKKGLEANQTIKIKKKKVKYW